MDWQLLTQQSGDFVRDNWLKIAWSAVWSVVILYLGTWWGRRRARSEWSSKQFLHRINFSLNQLRDNKLLIRTLAEMDCRDVFQNDVAVDRVLAAATRTDGRSAILPLARRQLPRPAASLVLPVEAVRVAGANDEGRRLTGRALVQALQPYDGWGAAVQIGLSST